MRLALYSLRHRRRRHLLNVFVIAATTAVVIVFTSVLGEIMRNVNLAKTQTDARIEIQNKLSQQDTILPMTLAKILRETPGVKDVEAEALMMAGSEEFPIVLNGQSANWANRVDPYFPVDEAARKAWTNDGPSGAIVSELVAKKFNLRVGQPVEFPTLPHLKGIGPPIQLKVSSIVYGETGEVVLVHLEYLDKWLENPGHVRQLRFYCAPADFPTIAPIVDQKFAQAGYPVALLNASQAMLYDIERAAAIPVVFGVLGLFLMLTTALTLANNSSISIRERRAELATLRVMGFKRSSLLVAVVGEAILIGIIGAAIAVGVMLAVFGDGIEFTPTSWNWELRTTSLGVRDIAVGVAVSVFLPLIGVLPSAYLSLRKPLSTALRESA